MLWYSLEVPHRGTSNEYPQHTFSSRNKKNINTFWLKKAPYQELCHTKLYRAHFELQMTDEWTDRQMDGWKNNVALTYPYHVGKSCGKFG